MNKLEPIVGLTPDDTASFYGFLKGIAQQVEVEIKEEYGEYMERAMSIEECEDEEAMRQMDYSDLKQYTINGHPVLTWGCRVLLRDVLDLAGYSKAYYFSAKCGHIEHDAPAIISASGRRTPGKPRVLAGARWTTIQDIDGFMQRTRGKRASDLADAIDALTDLLDGKRDPFDAANEDIIADASTTVPSPTNVVPEPVEIPTPADAINGRYAQTFNAFLGKVGKQLKASGDVLWLNGTVTIPVPNTIPVHIRPIMSEDVAKALEGRGWSVDVQKTTSDGGTSLALDVTIDALGCAADRGGRQ